MKISNGKQMRPGIRIWIVIEYSNRAALARFRLGCKGKWLGCECVLTIDSVADKGYI